MKKAVLIFVAVLIVASLILTLACAPAAPAKTYKFKWGGRYGKDSIEGKTFEGYFMQKVTELSKGAIQFDWYPDDQLGGMPELLEVVGGGSADFGLMVPASYTGKIPLLALQDLPFLFNADVPGHMKAVMALFDQPTFKAPIEKFGVKVIGGDCQGTMAFYFKQPLTKLEDFKGRKIRTAGAAQTDLVKALGAVGQSVASPEVYTSLQTGVLDGAMWQPLSAISNRLYEVTKYAVIPYISATGYSLARIVNANVWNSLPKDLQDVIVEAEKQTKANSLKVFPGAEKDGINTLKSKGMDIYMVPQAENQRWRDATKGVRDVYVQKNGADGQKLLDFVLTTLGEKK